MSPKEHELKYETLKGNWASRSKKETARKSESVMERKTKKNTLKCGDQTKTTAADKSDNTTERNKSKDFSERRET